MLNRRGFFGALAVSPVAAVAHVANRPQTPVIQENAAVCLVEDAMRTLGILDCDESANKAELAYGLRLLKEVIDQYSIAGILVTPEHRGAIRVDLARAMAPTFYPVRLGA